MFHCGTLHTRIERWKIKSPYMSIRRLYVYKENKITLNYRMIKRDGKRLGNKVKKPSDRNNAEGDTKTREGSRGRTRT
jgi:hypothetical protein